MNKTITLKHLEPAVYESIHKALIKYLPVSATCGYSEELKIANFTFINISCIPEILKKYFPKETIVEIQKEEEERKQLNKELKEILEKNYNNDAEV